MEHEGKKGDTGGKEGRSVESAAMVQEEEEVEVKMPGWMREAEFVNRMEGWMEGGAGSGFRLGGGRTGRLNVCVGIFRTSSD